ncbi:MAG: cation-transporting P-type ATPase, partial [Parachlamydiales bacterium]
MNLNFFKKKSNNNFKDKKSPFPYWNQNIEDVLKKMQSKIEGLSDNNAKERLKKSGGNFLHPPKKEHNFYIFLRQFKSPLILLFLFTAFLSLILKEHTNSIIIFIIVLVSCVLDFFQQKKAI